MYLWFIIEGTVQWPTIYMYICTYVIQYKVVMFYMKLMSKL